jgi:dTDP-4-dehydrorhamnose 3,5-epimerase
LTEPVETRPLTVLGAHELILGPTHDRRGTFVKIFQASTLAMLSLPFEVAELFASHSHRGVVRGLHFQAPPADVAKVVACLDGVVLDAVVDLRVGSPSYGNHCMLELSDARANAVYVPQGCAHGFLVTSEDALVVYLQSGEHDPEREGGVLWSSAGIEWGITDAVLSDRDAAFPMLDEFASPFTYGSA